MKSPADTIKDIAAEVQDVPAITGNKQDKEAYSKATIRDLWQRYTHPEGKASVREQVKATLARDPMGALDLLSNRNMREILRDTQDALTAVEKNYSTDVLSAVIETARKACKFQNLSLTHTTNWESSTYATDGGLEEVLEGKMLRSPNKLDPDCEHTMIFCGFMNADEPSAPANSTPTYFRMNNVHSKDMRRSLTVVKCEYPPKDGAPIYEDRNRCPFVGGNHMETAWTLATINNTLRRLQECDPAEFTAENVAELVHKRAEDALVEMMIPNQMNLQGHIFVNEGVEEPIERNIRASRVPKPEKKEISPIDGNEHLKRQPRKRGKTDGE